ncbi:hypothetical protein [Streptomyces sp. H27-C3]|uniref:hypothetical protein n=1 Tax=Streptomyces sp. H27-C3 TaxID=3046305 RepID=UPI0024B87872|nr:hypothetical protein [Streptomyces sp. H27-C3]
MTEGPTAIAAPSPTPDSTPSPSAGAAGSQDEPAALRTEFPFTLPRGYVDSRGTVHREGVMRLATARDELVPLTDTRVRENPAYLSVVLISRLITRLGGLTDVHVGIVEQMFAADLGYLQRFYEKINTDGSSLAATVCPECGHGFDIDMGSRLGE